MKANKSPQKLHVETVINLPYLKQIDPESITVSGFSAGGFMASHLLVIHSDLFRGAGVVCGGPYGFFVEHAQVDGHKPDVQTNIIPNCFKHEQENQIEPLHNLLNKKVFVFGGANDRVLSPGVTDKAS